MKAIFKRQIKDNTVTEMNIQHTEKSNKTILLLVIAVISGIIMGFTMNVVLGAEIPEAYNDTMNVTKNATNQTEGYAIDNYIEVIKKDICKTLSNQTEYEGCMNL